jgi:hypothetical protein
MAQRADRTGSAEGTKNVARAEALVLGDDENRRRAKGGF